MTDSQYIMIYIGALLSVVFIVLFVFYVVPLLIRRKSRADQIRYKAYPVAYAGDVKSAVPEKESVSTTLNNFYDKDGHLLNPEDYVQFVVSGNSMKFCGIRDGDLVFVASNFRIEQLNKFPSVLVIRQHCGSDASQYKLRRAWGIATYNDNEFADALRKIITSPEFSDLKSLHNERGKCVYPGDAGIMDDFFKTRLPKYKKVYIYGERRDDWDKTVVLSTTYDPVEGAIHFSIHPIADIIGIVKESFTVT